MPVRHRGLRHLRLDARQAGAGVPGARLHRHPDAHAVRHVAAGRRAHRVLHGRLADAGARRGRAWFYPSPNPMCSCFMACACAGLQTLLPPEGPASLPATFSPRRSTAAPSGTRGAPVRVGQAPTLTQCAAAGAQDFMRGAHCFFYPFTDLGWHALYANGSSAGPRKEGFIWHSEPGCVHLPANTRFCFHRCDTASCMLQEARAASFHTLGFGPWARPPRAPCPPCQHAGASILAPARRTAQGRAVSHSLCMPCIDLRTLPERVCIGRAPTCKRCRSMTPQPGMQVAGRRACSTLADAPG